MRTYIEFGPWFRVRLRLGAWHEWNANWHLHGFRYCFFSDCYSSGEFVTDRQVMLIGTVCQ